MECGKRIVTYQSNNVTVFGSAVFVSVLSNQTNPGSVISLTLSSSLEFNLKSFEVRI